MFSNLLQEIKKVSKSNVIKNIAIVVIITLIIKTLGFYKESVVAANYGLSELLDTYYIAFLLPGFIYNVFIEAFKSVFIPNYIAELKAGNNIASFQATGFIITAVISIFFMIICFLFTDIYLDSLFPGHTTAYYNLVKSQFYYILPCIIFWGLSSLLSGLLNINDEFKLSTFDGIFLPLTILGCLFFFKDTFGEKVLAIATLIGSIFGFCYLLVVCIKKNILLVSKPSFKNTNARLMFSQIPAKVTSGFLSGLHGVVDQYFAAQLILGSITALNYGLKIPAFAIGITVIAMSNVLLPYFSKLVLTEERKAFEQLFKLLKTIFITMAIIAVLGILTSDFFVSLFFERKEFTSEDTEIVSNIQKIILIYIPFKISGMLLVNFLTSINKNNYMAYVSLISIIINIVLNFILIKFYGVYGIAIATTTVVIIRNVILFLFTIKQRNIILK